MKVEMGLKSKTEHKLMTALLSSFALMVAPMGHFAPAYAYQEDDVEEDIQDDIEDDLESEIEEALEEAIEQDIEDSLEEDIESDLEDDLEAAVEDDLDDDLDDEFEDDQEEDDLDDEDDAEDDGEDDEDADDDDEQRQALFVDFDDLGQEIRRDERLVLLDDDLLGVIEDRGYQVLSTSTLDGLDLVVSRVSVPIGFDLDAEVQALSELGGIAEIDFNHVYRVAGPSSPSVSVGSQDMGMMSQTGLRIGMIDTVVYRQHPTLRGARIELGEFAPGGGAQSSDHGTAVASLLVGQAGGVEGYARGAQLFAASAFTVPANGTEPAASANSLVRSINWLVEQRTPVINMSLAGPPNRILEATVAAARARGYVVVAAMGNQGPSAPPLYPAGYSDVIAVTAVNNRNRVFRRAGRGPHLDFAAPGVKVRTAGGNDRTRNQTGTSFASPFVAAVILSRCGHAASCIAIDEIEADLRLRATDLGDPGFDETYGWGLVSPY